MAGDCFWKVCWTLPKCEDSNVQHPQRMLRINYVFSWVLFPLDSEIKRDFVSFRTSMFEIEAFVCLMEILSSSLFHGFISTHFRSYVKLIAVVSFSR